MKKINNNQSKKSISGYLLTDSLIIAFMLCVPYAFYLYNYFPDKEIFQTSFYTFESYEYVSVRAFFWVISSKILPLLLLIIWFTTCKHWWYYSIAIPIGVYIFQLIGALNDGMKFMDEFEFVYSIPITALILMVLLMIRSKIKVYLKAVNLHKEVDDVINKGIENQKKKQEKMENRKLF